jgi:hypothetical protein
MDVLAMMASLGAEAPGHGDDGAGPEAKRNVATTEDACHHHAILTLAGRAVGFNAGYTRL